MAMRLKDELTLLVRTPGLWFETQPLRVRLWVVVDLLLLLAIAIVLLGAWLDNKAWAILTHLGILVVLGALLLAAVYFEESQSGEESRE